MSNPHPIKPKNLLKTVDGAWRKQKPTDTQLLVISTIREELKDTNTIIPNTRGEASDLIHKLYSRSKK